MGILQEMWNHPKTLSGIPHLPLQPLLVILAIYHWMCSLLLYFIAPVNFNVTQLQQIPSLTILMFCQSGHRNTRVVEISDIVNRIAPKVSRWFFSTNIPNYSSVILLIYLCIGTCVVLKKEHKMRASALFSFVMSHTGKTTTRCWISSATVDRGQCPVHPRHPKAQRQEEVLQVGKCFIQSHRHVLNHAHYKRVLNLHFLVFFFSLCRQSTVEDLVKLARQFDKNMQDRESSEGAPTLRSSDKMQPLQCPSSSDRVEAELQALFDCSTQRVSGRLSQGSCSQEVKDQPAAVLLEPSRQTGPSSEKSVPAAGLKATALRSNNDFDDDWENDELLNDPLLLEITHNPPQLQDNSQASSQTNTKRESEQSNSGFQSAKMACGRQPSAARSELTCTTLQELCPKLKTTNRSTFKLEPNLHFQAKDLSRPALTPLQPKAEVSPINPTTSKTQPDVAASPKTDARGCSQGASDSQWEDGDDDSLLYQVCDSIERLDRLSSSPKNQHSVAEKAQRGTTPVSIDAGSRAQRESPHSFVRSNSLPATSSDAGTYRGWDCPMRGASSKPLMSQSLPGSHMTLGTFSQSRDWSGKLQTGIDGASKAGMVTARTAHPAFKRNFSDSAVSSNKGT